MFQHPDFILLLAREREQSMRDAARQRRLARSARCAERSSFADRASPLRRHLRLPWRQRELAVQMAR